MLCWNKAFWLAAPSHMTIFNQSEHINAAYGSYATLEFVNDNGSGAIAYFCLLLVTYVPTAYL